MRPSSKSKDLNWTGRASTGMVTFGVQAKAGVTTIFEGARWERIRSLERQAYLRNAYRVLLTRARQGMVIFVPPGSTDDPTRPPDFYDHTFGYLTEIGIPELQ